MTVSRSLVGCLAALAFVSTPAACQLAGVYSVNPAAAPSPFNFTLLGSAVTALVAQGVAGPVTFEIFDDAGPYTESNPFVTANTGGTWAPSDAVLTLGVWAGASAANRVRFQPAPGEQPVLDAAGRAMGVFWNGARFATIEGLEIRNAIFDGVNLYTEASHGQVLDAEILRCRIHDCGGVGVLVYGNTPNPTNTLIANNFFWNLQLAPNTGAFTFARSGYISTRRQINTRVLHNTFLVNTGSGTTFAALQTEPSCGTACVDTFGEVANNIFVKSVAASRPIFRYKDLGALTGVPPIHDSNCFLDTSGGPFAERINSGNVATIDPDLASWNVATAADANSLAADPMLVDPASGDLHLQPASPCIGAAVTAAGGVLVDIDGEARSASPVTGFFDIGADEVGNLASITFVGTGCAGFAGLVPTLSAASLPTLGNAAFAFDVAQARPNAPSYLFASAGVSGTPFYLGSGCNLYLDLPSLITFIQIGVIPFGPLNTSPAGTASFPFPIANAPALAGFSFAAQAMVIDGAVPLGITVTNALSVVVN